jgi:hypothetical protein
VPQFPIAFATRHRAHRPEQQHRARERNEQAPAQRRVRDVLLRVFCHAHGHKILLLLAGYDKGENPSPKRQNAEIKLAEKRLKRWRENEQRRAKPTEQTRRARRGKGR